MLANKYRYLFFIPSPRNIPEVKEQIVKILYKKHDVIWYKFYKEIDAYDKCRDYFLSHPEYDYLVIVPDDLLINQEGVDNLIHELENPSLEGITRYDILSGICNSSFINEQQMAQIPASQVFLPDVKNNGGIIMWDHMIKFADLYARQENLFQCKYIGFSFYFLHRSVVEEIPFRVDNPDKQSGGIDIFFCRDLTDTGIKQYIDKRSRFVHLRGLSSQSMNSISANPDVILVGKYRPYVVFVKRHEHTSPIIQEGKAVPIPTVFEPATTFSGPYKGPPAKRVPLGKKSRRTSKKK